MLLFLGGYAGVNFNAGWRGGFRANSRRENNSRFFGGQGFQRKGMDGSRQFFGQNLIYSSLALDSPKASERLRNHCNGEVRFAILMCARVPLVPGAVIHNLQALW